MTVFLETPVASGSINIPYGQTGSDQGLAVLRQSVTLVHNTTNAVSATMLVPQLSQLVDFLIDTTTAWNSSTSDTLSIGTTAAGTQYAGSVDVKAAAGRQTPTYTGAQLTAMQSVGANTSVVVTVTPSGSATAGSTTVTMLYVQNPNPAGSQV